MAVILLFPSYSVFADDFNIATSRTIYSPNEKVLVIGSIPDNAPSGLPVLISISSENGTICSTATALPSDDGNFVSLPLDMSKCGLGHYQVNASYGNLSSSTSFAISAKDKLNPTAALELRIIKSIINESRDLANSRLQSLLAAGQTVPSDIADSYAQGVAESSAALRAADFGDADGAKSHMMAAADDFRKVSTQLSSGGLQGSSLINSFSQSNDTSVLFSGAKDTLTQLVRYSDRLNELAVKNGLGNETWFSNVSGLLGQANGLLGSGDIQGAKEKFQQAQSLLERVRVDLMDKARASVLITTLNTSESSDNISQIKLNAVANFIEKRANVLLGQTIPSSAQDSLVKALTLAGQARTDIANGSFQDAKKALVQAFMDLNDARKTIENSHSHEDSQQNNSDKTNRKGSDSNQGENNQNATNNNTTASTTNDNSNSSSSSSDSGDSNSNQTQSSNSQSGDNGDNQSNTSSSTSGDNSGNSGKHR